MTDDDWLTTALDKYALQTNRDQQIARFLMLDLQLHPEMTLAEFHERHGISYD